MAKRFDIRSKYLRDLGNGYYVVDTETNRQVTPWTVSYRTTLIACSKLNNQPS